MIFIEVVALIVVASVIITVFMSVGRPVAEMLADKSRYKLKGIDSEAEARLLKRVEGLEEELRQTRSQLAELKDSTEFSVKMIEAKVEAKQIEMKPGNSENP